MALAGLDHLLRAAERLRWDDAALDLAGEAAAVAALDPDLRAALERLVGGFCVAEAAVAEHLAPFEAAAARGAAAADGDGPDPLLAACFAAQADDERRHARFFARALTEALGRAPGDARALAGPEVVALFEDDLPRTAGALAAGEVDLDRAVGLYHLVLEGIVFHAGQEALLALLDRAGTLPVLREGVARVQGDERWHVGLGVRCLADLRAAGAPAPDVAPLAARAAACWGPAVAGLVDLGAVLERHRRRLAVLEAQLGVPA